MVRDQNHPLWKIASQMTRRSLLELLQHTLVPTDSDFYWCPPIGHSNDNYAPELLRHGHPGVKQLHIEEI